MSDTSAYETARSELSSSDEFLSLPASPSISLPPPPSLPLPLASPSLPPPRLLISPPTPPTAPPPSPAMATTAAASQAKALGNGMFDPPFFKDPELSDEFQDLWLLDCGLDPFKHIPSLPWEYQVEWSQDRCVYLFGLPNSLGRGGLQLCLEVCGEVQFLPLIIDLASEQTFRFAIMATKQMAEQVINHFADSFPRELLPAGHHGIIAVMTAFAPGRARNRGGVVVAQDDLNSYLDKPTIWGYHGELGPGQDPGERSTAPPANPKYTKSQMERGMQTASHIIGKPRFKPFPVSLPQMQSSPVIPPGFLNTTPVAAQQPIQRPAFGSHLSNSVLDTPTPAGRGSSSASLFQTPSKVNTKDNVDSEEEGGDVEVSSTAMEILRYAGMDIAPFQNRGSMSTTATQTYGGMNMTTAQSQVGMNINPLGYTGYGYQPAFGMNQSQGGFQPSTSYGPQSTTQAASNPYQQTPSFPPGLAPNLTTAVDPLVARLRRSAAARNQAAPYMPVTQASSSRQVTPAVVQQAAPFAQGLPIVTPRKPSNPMVAVPDMTVLSERTRAMSISKGESASKTTSATKETLATIPEGSQGPKPTPVQGPVAKPLFSWANVAGVLPGGSNTIDVSNKLSGTARLRSLTGIPASSSTTSKNEPLVEQMRIVFLLDIPTTLTLNDISDGLNASGPLRSIHFGMDEEKNSRFCAIVFLHASDASRLTAALLKERADGRPSRFKFLVDVVRGEDPYPLDDTLRAMLPPTNATRRLTLVKSCFFSYNSRRTLTQLIERTIGEGCIQFIFLYNSGNATIVFSDVGSAILMKAEFDRLAQENVTWKGLQSTYSKDPCIVDANLKLKAVHADWNA